MAIVSKYETQGGLKRHWGVNWLRMGCAMCATLFITSLFRHIADSDTAVHVIYVTVGVGCALLGFNMYEKIKRPKPEAQNDA